MEYGTLKSSVASQLKSLELDFSLNVINNLRTLVALRCEMKTATFEYFLIIREDATPSIDFRIPLPLLTSAGKEADMLLYTTLMNQQQTDHPGHWVYDPVKGEISLVYCWHCDPTGFGFEKLFKDLFVGFISNADDCYNGIQAVIKGLLKPEDAVSLFINRHTTWLN